MKIASYNVENLFSRVRAMDQSTWNDGKQILSAYSQLNCILAKENYSDADKDSIIALLNALGLDKSNESQFVILRENRGHLVKRHTSGAPTVEAGGRDDWIGWLELKTEAVDETATEMTAKVIKEVDADIVAVIEAEDRNALKAFNEQLLRPLHAEYAHVMLIDGNDERGIDVGLMCKSNCDIASIASHVDEMRNGHPLFSRDCAEYTIQVSGGPTLLILVNHFKSKGWGTKAENDASRKAQASRVREIYDARRRAGMEYVAVVGDFNDSPESDPLEPLLGNGSDLRDVTQHPAFHDDGRPGSFANGTKSQKFDYLLLSPSLYHSVTAGEYCRHGVWGGVDGDLFPHYSEMTKPCEAASDHAAIWADIDI
jgi:endonuclease/exonuclease/phosphatase family metal-dependent hydrolase